MSKEWATSAFDIPCSTFDIQAKHLGVFPPHTRCAGSSLHDSIDVDEVACVKPGCQALPAQRGCSHRVLEPLGRGFLRDRWPPCGC